MTKKELWLKLRGYHFDHLVPINLWQHISSAFGGADAFSKAFAAKIARKHNWNKAFALQALSEYKKFVYLGVISDFSVTPSKIIDIVWHEHLLFTKGYRDFCDQVIAYQFDHSPELVPMEKETGIFSAQYLNTVELYVSEFGFAPLVAVWGETKFDKEKIKARSYSSRQKTAGTFDSSNSYVSDAALYSYFDGPSAESFAGFDGGSFGGGGASGDWSDGNTNDSGSGSDSSGSDSGGGDSGGGDSGGSSCSSCSGGGCGGGD
ncbi:MAG: hypothetical protein ABI685_08480 [Ferruginibacter sp.]